MCLPGNDQQLQALTMSKVFGASWNMVVAEAEEPIPLEPILPLHLSLVGLPGMLVDALLKF